MSTSEPAPSSSPVASAPSAYPPVGDVVTQPEHMVLVGRRWTPGEPTDWALWNKPYDDVVKTVTERAGDYRPGFGGFEVIEVTVHRRTAVASEVKVTEGAT